MGYFLSAHHTLTLLNIPRIILYFFNLFTEPRKIFLGCDCVGEVLDCGYEGEFDSFTFSESIRGGRKPFRCSASGLRERGPEVHSSSYFIISANLHREMLGQVILRRKESRL